MITYSGPQTFCRIVCEALKERQRQIKVRSFDFGVCVIEVAYEQVSITVSSRTDLQRKFFELCQQLNTKFKLGLRYQPDLGMPDIKINPPSSPQEPKGTFKDMQGNPMHFAHGPEAKVNLKPDGMGGFKVHSIHVDDITSSGYRGDNFSDAFDEMMRQAGKKRSNEVFDDLYGHDKPKRRYTDDFKWPTQ